MSEKVADARLHEEPGSLVLRLLLQPLDASVRVSLERRLQVAEWEWGDLFNSNDGDVVDSTLCSLVQ